MLPDVVYPLKKKSQYEELRYSLRSLQNVPHGRVFIAGAELPQWITNVVHVPVERIPGETRYQNAERNWFRASDDHRLTEDFISMNDDFFIMQPIESVEYFNDGPLEPYIEARVDEGIHPNYEVAMMTALNICKNWHIKKPIGYTLHVPMMMNKYKRMFLHNMFKTELDNNVILLMRTLYGNLFKCGGKHMIDVKFTNANFNKDTVFLSSNDQSFKNGELGEFIRGKFPNKSPYEI